MDRNERQVIDDLFARIREAEGRSGPRDPEAEARIREHLAGQPAAPYYMAQAIVVQQEALAHAQARLEQLEREGGRAGGGFLGGLFGGGGGREVQPQPASGGRASRIPATGAAAGQGGAGQRPGGSFLGGAAQTALGVAGGVLIANAIGGMLAADEAAAAEPEPPAADDPGAGEEAGWGDDLDDPGDLGDFSDF
jgi:uncharacterized protein